VTTSVADLLEDAARKLRAAGVIKPRREANRLWAWMHRVSPGESWLTRERPAGGDQAKRFGEAVERRVRGEPLAYVLGHTGFRRLTIRCDPRALIPRPETEGVIDLALSLARTGSALDIGTGTGCLALALADEGEFQVTAVDCSEPALSLAAENVSGAGLEVELIRSDLVGAVQGRVFDLIVSNPPYLSESEYDALDPSVKSWEPKAALVSGPSGLESIGRILRDAPTVLRPGGWLVMELDSARSAPVVQMAGALGWEQVRVERDLYGRDRYLVAGRGVHTGGGA
jgi:release factor glutamine methyltransferase